MKKDNICKTCGRLVFVSKFYDEHGRIKKKIFSCPACERRQA